MFLLEDRKQPLSFLTSMKSTVKLFITIDTKVRVLAPPQFENYSKNNEAFSRTGEVRGRWRLYYRN